MQQTLLLISFPGSLSSICHFLRYFVLRYFVLRYFVLRYFVLRYFIFSYFIFSYFIFSYFIFSYFIFSYFVLRYFIFSYFVFGSLFQSFLVTFVINPFRPGQYAVIKTSLEKRKYKDTFFDSEGIEYEK